ncbi:hypothetical protein BKA67DRAFT_228619 [Truncatella angustata]|uniref:Uncharacterized protein n=1 Tax=Truncatella angustata TaxID=152316 RepID=A0A9P8UNJ9_9PEZI|nr:uncharacterized protein BKA67DRAFT_228619 [Truncatella angustata]KAH6655189.1 hypothetical protein BKA67DRAFT_228619 [Truncatella angustata]
MIDGNGSSSDFDPFAEQRPRTSLVKAHGIYMCIHLHCDTSNDFLGCEAVMSACSITTVILRQCPPPPARAKVAGAVTARHSRQCIYDGQPDNPFSMPSSPRSLFAIFGHRDGAVMPFTGSLGMVCAAPRLLECAIKVCLLIGEPCVKNGDHTYDDFRAEQSHYCASNHMTFYTMPAVGLSAIWMHLQPLITVPTHEVPISYLWEHNLSCNSFI